MEYSDPILTNVKDLNNSSKDGGGIYCHTSNPVLEDVSITGNMCVGDWAGGGGISLVYSSKPTHL